MSASVPAGRDWVELLDARNNQRRGTNFSNSRDDPRFLLSVITDEWRLFKDKLSRAEQSFASELRDTGNKWGHGSAFSADDTYRALDTMERLLTAVDATAEADEVRKLRRDAQQAAFASETRRAVQAVTGVEGHGLKPWREVIMPHRDVRDGNLRGAEFAADLYYVSLGDGSRGVRGSGGVLPAHLPDRGAAGPADLGGAADRRGPERAAGGEPADELRRRQDALDAGAVAPAFRHPTDVVSGRAAEAAGRLSGSRCAPGRAGREPHRGREGLGQAGWHEGADAVGRAGLAAGSMQQAVLTRHGGPSRWCVTLTQLGPIPGAALGELIRAYAPCLILIDEWVAYARQLYGRDDLAGGTFDTQFTFAQTLTEAVKAVPGAMLVVSIPASSAAPSAEEIERGATDIEVGGMNGREALARLQQVIRRIADQWRPASAVESFAIVRQRLFEEAGASAQADIAAVARVFTDFYARNRAEFPAGVAEPSYEERIRAAYPVHPELFDRLYQDWSTLDKFQRTRGVLRLMSAVIHTLWLRDDPAPLILPGGVPLDADEVLSEITQYLEDNFKPVIDTDIDGASATPALIDASRPTYGQRRITRRIARTVFLGSAPTLKAAHKGIEQPRVWLGMATPGDAVGNFGSALHLLSDQATYLYNEGARYWYDTHASVNRMAEDQADRLKDRPEETWEEILRRLRTRETSVRGMFARVQAGPENSGEIADDPAVRLVILHPQLSPRSRGQRLAGIRVRDERAGRARQRAADEPEHDRLPRRRRPPVPRAGRGRAQVPGVEGHRGSDP